MLPVVAQIPCCCAASDNAPSSTTHAAYVAKKTFFMELLLNFELLSGREGALRERTSTSPSRKLQVSHLRAPKLTQRK